jgi:ABC-2 type transport system permease protein
MNSISIFLYEWKHFIRSPFKILAILFFVLAGIYGLHNGANLYQKQKAEITKIKQKVIEQQEKILAYYNKGEKSPKDRPWIDLTNPFWAIWSLTTYHFKTPSPAIVYSMGQAEQYGFYKSISVNSSPYDADMAEEISNPERLQTGTLDFSFVVIFLLPLLLLILLYNIKVGEAEQGFLPLIYVQTGEKNKWLLARVAFYGVLLFMISFALLLYGAMLTRVFESQSKTFFQIGFWILLYLLFWILINYLILLKSKTIVANILQMVGVWLIFAFIIPASVHQWVSIEKPTNLMIDMIDVWRNSQEKIFSQPDSVIDQQLYALIPEIQHAEISKDTTRKVMARMYSMSALAQELLKASITAITKENQAKNDLIGSSFWFNPVSFFQNKFNTLSQTHYQDYENYRQGIQTLIDKRIKIMVVDIWKDTKVDKNRYLEYNQIFKK